MRKNSIIIIACIFSIFLFYIKNTDYVKKIYNNMNNNYEWLVLTAADDGYPMEIIYGELTDPIGRGGNIPTGQLLRSRLFGDAGMMIVGDEFRPLPHKMKIKWFSYAENKFFKGEFDLDHKYIEAIFEQEEYIYRDGGGIDFKVVPIPGGKVMLYLYGVNTFLLGIYQGEEYIVKDDDAFHREMRLMKGTVAGEDTRLEYVKFFQEELPKQTLNEINNNTIPTDIWDKISVKYPWRFTFHLVDRNDYPEKIVGEEENLVVFINAEKRLKLNEVNYFITPEPKPIPIELATTFDAPGGRYEFRVFPGNVGGKEFSVLPYEQYRKREQQLVKLFKEFYERIGKQPFDLHLEIDKKFENPKLYLKKDDIMQEIPNVEFELFNSTFDIQLYPKE